MKIVKLALLCLFVVTLASSCSKRSSATLTKAESAAIHLMLSQTHEVKIHQMRGATENQVFVHKDGHKEAVYNGKGNLVQDGINDGSYNYAHPEEDPFGHFVQDINPWLKMGMSREDPTSKQERIYAYMLDLEGGIVRARGLWSQKTSESLIEISGNSDYPKIWAKVLNDPEARKLIGLINGDTEMTDESLISTLTTVNNTFDEIY